MYIILKNSVVTISEIPKLKKKFITFGKVITFSGIKVSKISLGIIPFVEKRALKSGKTDIKCSNNRKPIAILKKLIHSKFVFS